MESTGNQPTYGQCRCCLVTGYHKDILKTYYVNGKRVVYFDVFLDCFNLFLSGSEQLTTLICAACIQQLSEANKFKVMVLASEQTLLDATGNAQDNMLFVHVPEVGVSIKTEQSEENEPLVKLELVNEADDELEIQDNFPAEDSLDIGHERDIRAPVVTSKECGLVEGEAELLARFPRNTLKRLPARDMLYRIDPKFDHHLDSLKDKIILPSMIEDLLKEDGVISTRIVRKRQFISEKVAHITNAAFVLENSNVTPFKSRTRNGFPCFFCRTTHETIQEMKDHQKKEHQKRDIRPLLSTYGPEAFIVYVDTSDLKCTICNENIKNLAELKSHLVKTHKLKYYADETDRVIPFKLSDNNIFECQVCGFSFETFGSIERHMNSHFRNYVCKECGSGFVTTYRLKVHMTGMHSQGSFPCPSCKKVFTSSQKLKNHVNFVHKLAKRFKCPKCAERFTEYFQRQKHLVSAHGVAPLEYKCRVCDKSFDRRYLLSRHMKRDHLEERDFQCEACPYSCFTKNELRVHMIKHNGERIHECSVCKKAYARKKTLKEHMRIHQNDRRFVCGVCGQSFVQKCSLKGHMKAHHVDYTM